MIAWILTLWANPLARKIITYAAVIAAICWCLRWWGNRQWARGEAQGRQYMALEMERQKQAEWKAKEAAIAAAAAEVAGERRSITAAAEQLALDRQTLVRSLNGNLAQIQRERSRQYESVAAVPDDRLWDSIRAISRELAAQ